MKPSEFPTTPRIREALYPACFELLQRSCVDGRGNRQFRNVDGSPMLIEMMSNKVAPSMEFNDEILRTFELLTRVRNKIFDADSC